MRVGNNPLNGKPAPSKLANIVLLVVTHLPETHAAYHAERFEVIQTCLRSMTSGVNAEHSLIVWDNGSIPQLRDWIETIIKPDVFIKSVNVGKSSARKAMLNMLPPQTIACYSDDDIYFYPDWLYPQMTLLDCFPNVACVTGYPVRTSFRWGNENTKIWARKNAKLDIGHFIPDEWENDFALSVGRTPEFQKAYTVNDVDYRITYKGKQAFATSHHCQVIGYSEVLAHAAFYDNDAMGDEKPFDEALDRLGLRLATTNRLARHIGNVIDDELRNQIETANAVSVNTA